MDLKQLPIDPRLMAIAVAAVLVVAVLAWLSARTRRTATTGLRRPFGPEYDWAVREHGSARRAEAHVTNREKRLDTHEIRNLDPAERERFSLQWRALQSRFVDDPTFAVTEADAILTSLMQTRGYPVADLDQRAADMSVDHPRVVADYRSAHQIAVRLEHGDADAEALRTAMIHYRSLFEELVHGPAAVGLTDVA
jgi:hypothetical protein